MQVSRSRFRLVLALAATLSMVVATAAIAAPAGPGSSGSSGPSGLVEAPAGAEVVPDSYIVVLDDDHPMAVARQHARQHGAEVRFVYEHALTGYAASMSEQAAAAIARDPRVAWVEPETLEEIQSQTLPTGIDRIETDRNPTVTTDADPEDAVTVDVPIAVLDTGISEHPDLNLVQQVDCTEHSGGPPFSRTYSCVEDQGDDDNGHGTHVAGTIGAKDNGEGVVGVAPGTPLWSVKVCPTNSCPEGAIIAGIDWVAGQKSEGEVDFAAANFSISSADSDNSCDDPENSTHAAICGLVDTGVSFVMAAGNDGREKVPYPVAFSVSAIADFDGKAGGEGEPTCRDDEDDTLANFSNYGPKIDIAAPGVCILSTWNDGGHNTISGTSMAAPHVTGAVALYIHANDDVSIPDDRTSADAIKAEIIDAAHPQGTSEDNPCSYDDERTGGPLLFVNAETFSGDGTCGVAGEVATGTIAGTVTDAETEDGIEDATVTVEGTELSATTDADGAYSIGDVPEGTHDVTASADGYGSATQSVTVTEDETTTADFALAVEEAVEGAVTVNEIDYGTRGGRTNDRHLDVTVSLVDDEGNPVADASVAATLERDDGASWNLSGTTGSDGTVTFTLNNHGSGCYETTITAVDAGDLTWGGGTPENGYCKD